MICLIIRIIEYYFGHLKNFRVSTCRQYLYTLRGIPIFQYLAAVTDAYNCLEMFLMCILILQIGKPLTSWLVVTGAGVEVSWSPAVDDSRSEEVAVAGVDTNVLRVVRCSDVVCTTEDVVSALGCRCISCDDVSRL